MNTNPVFFYSAKSENEAQIILSKLKADGIEAFIKNDIEGNYSGNKKSDIYVPYDALMDANNILSINESDLLPFEGRNSEKSSFSGGFVKKALLLLGAIAVLAVAIYVVSKFAWHQLQYTKKVTLFQ